MEKYGTTPALTARVLVVGEYDHKIIEAIGPAHRFVACRIGQAHRPVVVAVTRRVTPAFGNRHGPRRKARSRRQGPVGPIHNSQELPAANRRGSVAFLFPVAAARPSDNTRESQRPHSHDAFRGSHADRANVNICDDFPHGDLSCGRCYQQAKVTVTAILDQTSPPGPSIR